MNIKKLDVLLGDQPRFRHTQVRQAVFRDLIDSWERASSLPLALRQKLTAEFSLDIPATITATPDGLTVKALVSLANGQRIETVLMRHSKGRNTVCVSSQVGCAMGCVFCATGAQGFTRHLTDDEIVLQVLLFARYLKPFDAAVTNVVYMGMGEPFHNYEAVLQSINTLRDPSAFGLGSRHISISTAGVVAGIDRFAKENFQVNLAVSLHAPNNELRKRLMPSTAAYPIENIMEAVSRYIKLRKRRVMFEYLMIKGINDSAQNARDLARLLHRPLHFVNLIRYNPTASGFLPSDGETVRAFKETLEKSGIPTTQRYTFGHGIKAACGQLAGRK